MNILFAWEFGGHLGHILRQKQIAQEMRLRGHDILFAVKDLSLAQRSLGREHYPYVQAPALPFGVRKPNQEILSYADILAAGGFIIKDLLHSLLHAWQTLFRLYKPDVVILDYSPSALLAARLAGVPFVMAGTGFEVPPAVSPFPCFRPDADPTAEQLLQNEAAVLKNVNALCAEQKRPAFGSLAECMTSPDALLLTFAEFDHYPRGTAARYLGPLFSEDAGQDVAWSGKASKKIFAYLRPNPELTTILDGLRASEAEVICVVTDIHPDIQAKFQTQSLRILNAPVKLSGLIEHCDLVVAHNGHGLLSACALHGIPVLGIPTQIEQRMLADCIDEVGIGVSLSLSEIRTKLRSTLAALLGTPAFKEKAAALAVQYRNYDQAQVLRAVAENIENIASQ